MIKNKMAKLVGTAMAATFMLSVAVPVVANANEKEVAPQAAQTQESNLDQEQLGYAIQEINMAIEILDNENLIDRDNYDRMVIFANTAIERISGMDAQNEYVQEINRLANEITNTDNDILRRVMTDVEEVQKATGEDKEAWINALNESVSYAKENGLLNDATLRAAIDVLHREAGVTQETGSKEDSVDKEQLGYAIQEINMAIEILDNENLINRDNYDRMVIFANTAIERISGMDAQNEYVQEINRLANEITTTDNNILRRVMTDVEEVQKATGEDKEAWINALNESVSYAKENGLLNDATLRAAIDVLHTEAGIK